MDVAIAKCPNCGANIVRDDDIQEYICEYCGSTVYIKDNSIRAYKSHKIKKTENDKKCQKVSEKFNLILSLYDGSKNEMLLMLKEKVGLVNSGKTLAKFEMMKSSQSYSDEPFDEPFTYRIADRTLDRFEYKSDGSIELTYETDEDGFFAIEYYGRVTKYKNIDELLKVLDEIIEEVKIKFNKE